MPSLMLRIYHSSKWTDTRSYRSILLANRATNSMVLAAFRSYHLRLRISQLLAISLPGITPYTAFM